MFDPEQQVSFNSMDFNSNSLHRKKNNFKKSSYNQSDSDQNPASTTRLLRLLNPFSEEPATPDLTSTTKNLFIYTASIGLFQTLITNTLIKFLVISSHITHSESIIMYLACLLILLILTIQIRGLLIHSNEKIIGMILFSIYSVINFFFLYGFSYFKRAAYLRVPDDQRFKYMEYRMSGLGIFASTCSVIGYALMLFLGTSVKFLKPKSFYLTNLALSLVLGIPYVFRGSWEKHPVEVLAVGVLTCVVMSLVMTVQVKFVNSKLRNDTEFNITECIYLAMVGRFRGIMAIALFVLKGTLEVVSHAVFY